MAGTLTTSSAENVIALCEQGIYEPCAGSTPIDLLARGMVESATGDIENAKDLLTRAYFSLNDGFKNKAGVQLAVAYWRGGEKSEAWALLDTLPDSFDVLLTRAIIETDSDPKRALETLAKAQSYDVSRYRWGRLHNQRGICRRRLGDIQGAKAEYEAALFFWQDCPFYEIAQNNLAAASENSEEAHAHLDRAIDGLKGPYLAQSYDLKAKTFLREGHIDRATQYAAWAVGLLENTDRKGWLAETLLTYSDALIADDRYTEALVQLDRVWEIGSYLDDSELKLKAAQLICEHSKTLQKTYHVRSVQVALSKCRSFNAAARDLGISRQALQEFMRVHKLKDTTRRIKSLIKQN